MKTTTSKRESKTQRIKLMLLAGRRLTKKGLDRTMDLTNSGQCIKSLRKQGMPIRTDWKRSSEGTRYGVYSYDPPKKVSRIKNRQYLDQAYPKGLTN